MMAAAAASVAACDANDTAAKSVAACEVAACSDVIKSAALSAAINLP